MDDNARDRGPTPRGTGVTRLVTTTGSIILVDWDVRAYKRSPAHSQQLDGDEEWLFFTRIGAIELGKCASIERVNRIAARYKSSPIVAIQEVVPAPGLSAAELETLRLVGRFINRSATPPVRREP